MADVVGHKINIEGAAADGSSVSGNPVQIGGSDGSNARYIIVDGNGRLQITGAAVHDSPVVGAPLLLGGYASENEPTAISADGDAVRMWLDHHGRVVTLPGHANPEAPVTFNATASGDSTAIAAPGASVSLHIVKGTVHNRDNSPVVVSLRDGTAGTIRWRAELSSNGGGAPFNFGAHGWALTANTLLAINLSASGDVDLNVTEYYIAP